ncbi:hypothetical protein ACFQE1_09400 [Halobium palmae]|uniref:Uncharacterized protein n=1 Tax=Halobium palmae TaxID=1776492 RepID=A0ABD5RZ75_9EURY
MVWYHTPHSIMEERDSFSEVRNGLSMSRRMALAFLGMGALSQTASAGGGDGDDGGDRGGEGASGGSEGAPPREEFEAYVDEVLPGDKFGKVRIGPYTHTLQLSGTREPSWLVNPLHGDAAVDSDSYERIADVGYGVIPFSPGTVPVLRIVGHIDGEAGSETSIRVSIANREAYVPAGLDELRVLEDGPVRQTLLEVTGTGETQVFDEVYLSDVEDVVTGLDNGHPLPSHTLLFEAKTETPDADVTVGGATSVALELEAL